MDASEPNPLLASELIEHVVPVVTQHAASMAGPLVLTG
jgi:hypothetical protein